MFVCAGDVINHGDFHSVFPCYVSVECEPLENVELVIQLRLVLVTQFDAVMVSHLFRSNGFIETLQCIERRKNLCSPSDIHAWVSDAEQIEAVVFRLALQEYIPIAEIRGHRHDAYAAHFGFLLHQQEAT